MNISVAMCTYNGARFLAAQLESIAKQTVLPVEIVICDDGSTDATADIVESFARGVSFPVIFHRNTVNLRSTKNFEQAIGLCRGDAIALCDQDDLWKPEKLQILARVLENEPDVAGVFSNAALIDDAGVLLEGTLWDSIRFTEKEQRAFQRNQAGFLLQRPAVTGAAFLFRSQFVGQVLPIPPEWVHDAWIALILASFSRLKAEHGRLISYRLHSSQQLGVRMITKSEALQRGRQERLGFYFPEAARWALMADKLATLPVAPEIIRYARAKAQYMQARGTLLERPRAARVLGGLVMLPGHFRFAWGPVSYLRDFLHA